MFKADLHFLTKGAHQIRMRMLALVHVLQTKVLISSVFKIGVLSKPSAHPNHKTDGEASKRPFPDQPHHSTLGITDNRLEHVHDT